MRRYVLINEDGTVNNILYVENAEAISNNEDYSSLSSFDYTDWAIEDHPRTNWTYDFETQQWDKVLPETNALTVDVLVALEDPAVDELLGGN